MIDIVDVSFPFEYNLIVSAIFPLELSNIDIKIIIMMGRKNLKENNLDYGQLGTMKQKNQ